MVQELKLARDLTPKQARTDAPACAKESPKSLKESPKSSKNVKEAVKSPRELHSTSAEDLSASSNNSPEQKHKVRELRFIESSFVS